MLKIAATTTGQSLAQMPASYRRAAAEAVTKTGFDVRDALRQGMQQAFDKPKPFTLNAFRVAQATPNDMTAVVWAMPLQARYLFWEIEGGARASKGFEHKLGLFGGKVAIPVGKAGAAFERNPYGFVGKMFGGIQAGGYFIGTPKGQGGRGDGVFARMGKGGRKLVKIMDFADSANYSERLDVHGIASTTVGLKWQSQLMRALAR